MQPSELVRHVSQVCNTVGCAYYITGSVASSFYGDYRTTRDLDVVVELAAWHVSPFCDGFPPDNWFVDREAAMRAVGDGSMFNIIHTGSAMKIDIMPFKDGPFEESRLHRARRQVLLDGTAAMFATPEDVILKKLEFYREGRSEKHIRDITGMMTVSQSIIDMDYLRHWVLRIGVGKEWAHLCGLLNIPK